MPWQQMTSCWGFSIKMSEGNQNMVMYSHGWNWIPYNSENIDGNPDTFVFLALTIFPGQELLIDYVWVFFAAVKMYKKQALIQSHLRTFWSSQNLPDWSFVCPYISSTLVKPAAKENDNLINLEAICEKLVFNQLCVSPDDTGANWLTWRNEGWAQINQKCWWSAQTKKPASKLNTLTKCWNIKGWSLLLCLISSAAQTQQLITSVFEESDVWV